MNKRWLTISVIVVLVNNISAQSKLEHHLNVIYSCLDTLIFTINTGHNNSATEVYSLNIYELNDTCNEFMIDEITDSITYKYDYAYISSYFTYKNRFVLLSTTIDDKYKKQLLSTLNPKTMTNKDRYVIGSILIMPTYYNATNKVLDYKECSSKIMRYYIKQRQNSYGK